MTTKFRLVTVAACGVCRHEFRPLQAELRARFDEHKDERDMVKVQKILEDAEKEFEKRKHVQPLICTLCF